MTFRLESVELWLCISVSEHQHCCSVVALLFVSLLLLCCVSVVSFVQRLPPCSHNTSVAPSEGQRSVACSLAACPSGGEGLAGASAVGGVGGESEGAEPPSRAECVSPSTWSGRWGGVAGACAASVWSGPLSCGARPAGGAGVSSPGSRVWQRPRGRPLTRGPPSGPAAGLQVSTVSPRRSLLRSGFICGGKRSQRCYA